jgi:hypothetical protein
MSSLSLIEFIPVGSYGIKAGQVEVWDLQGVFCLCYIDTPE